MVTASKDKITRIWDVKTGKCIHTFTGHTDEVRSAQFNHNGTQLLTTGRSKTFWEWHAGTLCIWDVETGQLLHIKEEHNDAKILACFSPDGSQVVTSLSLKFDPFGLQKPLNDRTAYIWDIKPLQNLIRFFKKDAILKKAMDVLLLERPKTDKQRRELYKHFPKQIQASLPQAWTSIIKQAKWRKILTSNTVICSTFVC